MNDKKIHEYYIDDSVILAYEKAIIEIKDNVHFVSYEFGQDPVYSEDIVNAIKTIENLIVQRKKKIKYILQEVKSEKSE